MPTESIVILAAIILAFLVFAGTLAWGDYCTRDIHHPGPAE
jgi:hypothetical protein